MSPKPLNSDSQTSTKNKIAKMQAEFVKFKKGVIKDNDYYMNLNGFLEDGSASAQRDIRYSASALLPPELCVKNSIYPESFLNGTLTIEAGDALSIEVRETIVSVFKTMHKINKKVTLTVIPVDNVLIKQKIRNLSIKSNVANYILELESEPDSIGQTLTRLFNEVLSEAVFYGASDIHLLRTKNSDIYNWIFYRINGELEPFHILEDKTLGSLIKKIKTDAGMDASNDYVQEDGRHKFTYNNRDVDLRIAYQPLRMGERMVMRILDSNNLLTIDKLYFRYPEIVNKLKNVSEIQGKESGLVLVCGPTGQGKTTTLYGLLRSIDRTKYHVITIEDPIEYETPFTTQIQYNREIHGGSMSNILRSVVRQDPDVIMIGEIRDYETLLVALQAAQSGHLVLASVHSDSAAQTPKRLLGMSPIEMQREISAMLFSSLRGIIHQYLPKKSCPSCYKEIDLARTKLGALLNIEKAHMSVAGNYECKICNGKGYYERIAAPEAIFINEVARQEIISQDLMKDSNSLEIIRNVEGVFYQDRIDCVKILLKHKLIDVITVCRLIGVDSNEYLEVKFF